MKIRRNILGMSAGATILGIALCVPATMLAQTSTAPPDTSSNQAQQSNPQGTMPSHHPRRHHHKWTAKDQLHHLTKELNLTESQQQQMLPVLQGQHEKMKSLKNNTTLNREERRQQMRQSMQETNQKLEALMTDTQKQKFEQKKRERHAHMQQRHHPNGMGMHQGTPNEATPAPSSGAPAPQL